MIAYAIDPVGVQLYQEAAMEAGDRLFPPSGSVPKHSIYDRYHCEYGLQEDLHARLLAGELDASGFTPGTLEFRPIPAAWWLGARLDLKRSAATSPVGEMINILVFAPVVFAPVVFATEASGPKLDRNARYPDVVIWYRHYLLLCGLDADNPETKPPGETADIAAAQAEIAKVEAPKAEAAKGRFVGVRGLRKWLREARKEVWGKERIEEKRKRR